MTVFVLFVLLIVMLYLSYITSKGILFTPQFGFAISFIPQALLALFYVKKWNLDIGMETVLVIVGGICLFTICNVVFNKVKFSFNYGNKLNKNNTENNDDLIIRIDTWKFLVLIIFQLLTILLCIRYLLSLVPGVDLLSAITYYRYTNLFSNNMFVIPSYIRMMRTFSISSGYVLLYIYIHSMLYKDKVNKIFVLSNIGLSLVNDMLFGARTGLAIFAVSFVVQYYFIRGKKYGWKNALPFKSILKIVFFVFLFLATFQTIAEIMGRTLASEYTFMDYIAGYLSAEIKNLDVFLKKGNFGTTWENNQTLNGIIPLLAKVFDQPQWVHKLDLPFVIENNYNYGNVYTIFYPFIYDMGYIGILVYIPLMACICQVVYKKIININDNDTISISLIIYSYIYFALVFSFFSDKFYEIVLNTKFIWTLLSWIVLKKYFEIRIKIKR